MMSFKPLLTLSAITLATLSTPISPAQANSFCDRISDPYQRFYCQGREATARAQQARVNSYTPRQRYLAQAVSQLLYSYYQRTGQVLPVNTQVVVQVMQLIGANQSEAAFVGDRMVANVRGIAALQQLR